MIQSPVSPESPEDRKYGARAFGRIHDYEAGLEVAAHQNREKIDLDPVVVLNQPEIPLVHDGHGRWREAPQVIDTTAPQAMGDAALEPTTPSAVTRSATVTSRDRDPSVAEKGPSEMATKEEGKRVCGVGIKVFLLIVALVILLVAAIVGGAVGGTLAKKSASSPPANANEQGNGTKTTSGATPSATTQNPHVHFRLQTYSKQNMQGDTQLFIEPGLYQPGFRIASYVWITAKEGDDLTDPALLRCSVGFCKNETLLGWRGASNMRQTGTSPTYKAETNFLILACGLVYPEPDCRNKGFEKPDATRTVATVGIVETPSTLNPDSEFADVSTTSADVSSQVTSRPSANDSSQATSRQSTRSGSQIHLTESSSRTSSRSSTATETQSG